MSGRGAGHGEKGTRLRERAIAALLSQPTIGEAARSIGIGEETLRRWVGQEDFAKEYRRARRDLMTHVGAKLQQAATEAVAALVEIVKDTAAPAGARVSGARVILEMGARTAELEDLEVRVSAIEQSAAGASKNAIH